MSHESKPPVKTSWRNWVAWVTCNWIMNHVATEWYRTMIDGAIRYGLAAAIEDYVEERKEMGKKAEPAMCAACGSKPATDGTLCSGCAAKANAAARKRNPDPDPS